MPAVPENHIKHLHWCSAHASVDREASFKRRGSNAGCKVIQGVNVKGSGFVNKKRKQTRQWGKRQNYPRQKGRIPVRLITLGSQFPLSLSYYVRSAVLKETRIQSRPTFHLCLTFMSCTRFYCGKGSVSPPSSGTVLLLHKPCRPL